MEELTLSSISYSNTLASGLAERPGCAETLAGPC